MRREVHELVFDGDVVFPPVDQLDHDARAFCPPVSVTLSSSSCHCGPGVAVAVSRISSWMVWSSARLRLSSERMMRTPSPASCERLIALIVFVTSDLSERI